MHQPVQRVGDEVAVKIENGELVCDVCERAFEQDSRVVQEWTTGGQLQSFFDTDDNGAHVSYNMFLRKFLTDKTYKHAECCKVAPSIISGQSNRLDALKAELAALDSSQQQSVYEFLHDACGRRMW